MKNTNSWQQRKQSNFRNSHGYTLEMFAGIIVLIPILLCLFDIGVMLVTAQMNDTTCRNVARIASSGEPQDVQTRVEAAIKQAQVNNSLVTNLRLDQGYPLNDANVSLTRGAGTEPVNGKVTVRIAVDVHPPFLISHVMQHQAITMHAEQTYPYTYVRHGSSELPN